MPAAQVVIRDITEKKKAEDALKRTNEELEKRVEERTSELRLTVKMLRQEIEERNLVEKERSLLASAVESTAEAVVITDAKGLIQYVNKAFEKVTGYGSSETSGKTLHLLDSGKHDEAFFRGIRATLERDNGWSGRLINKKKDGALYYEECTISPVRNLSGKIVNYVSVKRDITDRMRLESIAEAVTTMNNIGYVFSGISHEIGKPVSALLVTLDLLKSTLDASSKETISEYADRALSQVTKIEYLLTSLKNFNLFETPESQDIRISSFMGQFLPLISGDFAKRGIRIETEFSPEAEHIYADPRAMQQILLNIFTNAADALENRTDPRIGIRVFGGPGGAVCMRIEDNGCGMTDEQMASLFKPFYTSKPHGTGLGMVIIKNMLTKMGGTIEVVSRKDEGTTVSVTIPGGVNG
jgi:PAS domain S-box-containing protein